MNPIIVSTFDPRSIPYKKHALMFEKLFEIIGKQIKVRIIPSLNDSNLQGAFMLSTAMLSDANMIFHNTGLLMAQFHHSVNYTNWLETMIRARGICWSQQYHCENKKEQEYVRKINNFIKSQHALLNSDIHFEREEEVYKLLEQQKIPIVPRLLFEEETKDFPIVLKEKNTTQGSGVYFIENKEQWKKILSVACKENWVIMPFIESPGMYYTHYRVYTVGSEIIAAVLCYSGVKKSDDRRIVSTENIYDNPESIFFLNRKQIASNRTYGGKQIPLQPNLKSRQITKEEKNILKEHGIENQEIPTKLVEYATVAAKTLSSKGLFILGQDWVHDKAGNFFCLEMNWGPELGSIDVVYNGGKEEDDTTRSIAAEKIAQVIIRRLTSL